VSVTRPTLRVPGAVLAVAAVAAAQAVFGLDPTLWQFAAAVVAGFLLVDLLLLRQPVRLALERQIPHSLPVNRWSSVGLLLRHDLQRPAYVQLFEQLPAGVGSHGLPATLLLQPGHDLRAEYQIRPYDRGDLTLGRALLLRNSTLGCWQLKQRLGEASSVRVYPDFALISGYLAMLPDQRSAMLGIRKAQRRGQGTEFHQLREYRHGDALRQIDWKATSRRRELIAREYEEERNQQLLFLLDSGRRMRSREGELSHFDHALNAMLLLAYIALRQGDVVSAMSFGAVDRWVPPQRGAPSINRLLNAVYHLQSGTAASDYIAAAERVMTRQRKRTLIVLLTNLREEDQDLVPALELLRSRHLVLLANLREEALTAVLGSPVTDFDHALRYAGAVHYLQQRERLQRLLQGMVDLLIDSTPTELPIRIVNGYWSIKRSGRL
jgi:uncharacterized protein (DUF58 family)